MCRWKGTGIGVLVSYGALARSCLSRGFKLVSGAGSSVDSMQPPSMAAKLNSATQRAAMCASPLCDGPLESLSHIEKLFPVPGILRPLPLYGRNLLQECL